LIEYLRPCGIRLSYEKGQGFEEVRELAKVGIHLSLGWLRMIERLSLGNQAEVANRELRQLDPFEFGELLLEILEVGAMEIKVVFRLAMEPADGAHANGALQELLEGSRFETVVLKVVARGRLGAGGRDGRGRVWDEDHR
jgi:hypothetical protein